jgi:hypothetical protein
MSAFKTPLNLLEMLSTNILSELYCLVMKLLLASGAIWKLPRKVPACYANPGLICMEKLPHVSCPVSQFLKDKDGFFQVDRRRAGVVTKILQQKPEPVINTEDARHVIKRKEDQQSGTTRQPNLLADQYSSRVIWNSNQHHTKNRVYENSEDKSSRRSDKCDESLGNHVPSGQHTGGAAGHGTRK